ncbi:hypothetical protein [uncultured Streptomyces sp.]|uniref:hypothetical protein n=1 Tax=uncultured Streptomyces sp. TaxID=174707 RepID=UPI002605004D|nr:hypothetical protein [uncultured Streptomyces sp.]
MSPDPGARRARVITVEPALTQLTKFTADETHRLDRAIVAISVNPDPGTGIPGTLLRDSTDDIDGVRVIHFVDRTQNRHDRRLHRGVTRPAPSAVPILGYEPPTSRAWLRRCQGAAGLQSELR